MKNIILLNFKLYTIINFILRTTKFNYTLQESDFDHISIMQFDELLLMQLC